MTLSQGKNRNMEKQNERRWIPCPICGKNTKYAMYENTVLLNFPLYCRKCNNETLISVAQYKVVQSDELEGMVPVSF